MKRNQSIPNHSLWFLKGSALRKHVIVCLSLVLYLLTPASLSTDVRLTAEEMVSRADAAIVGTVMQVVSYRGPHNLILTDATIGVEEVLFGPVAPIVTVTTAGGALGDEIHDVSGEPKLEEQRRYLVFIRSVGDKFRILGRLQGQFSIFQNAEGIEIAQSAMGTNQFLGPPDEESTPRTENLQIVIQLIREVARRLGRQ